jgi:hypothetical protein
MTRIAFEIELELETSYRPEKPATRNDPPEAEEIEIISCRRIFVDDKELDLTATERLQIMRALVSRKDTLRQIEDRIRDDYHD